MIVLTLSVSIIIFFFAYGLMQLNRAKNEGSLTKKRRMMERWPSLISTLGVLGTFIGIALGLIHFDSSDLNHSIPDLLDGLRTAFVTSILGMVFSLIFSRIISKYYDDLDEGVSDINMAAGQITKAVSDMSKAIIDNTNQQAQIQAAFHNTVLSTLSDLNNGVSNFDGKVQDISGTLSQVLTLQNSMSVNSKSVKEAVANLDRNLGEVMTIVEASNSMQQESLDETKKFGDKLHNEVVEIEGKMEETNKLLDTKFNEFTELLKKSNTEALVEVMKKVTEEFNKQMKELINKLVQENFEQLNKSVEQLNTWQQENKTMIESLTRQYKDMATSFESTSTVLATVSTDTRSLVADGGKLQSIVNALNAVMVEDEKFIQIITQLSQSAELNKASMVEFKDAQSSLNEWVRKQRNFVEAVQALMSQLEDISKINNYAETFWKETRQGMNESIGILKDGSKQLNTQITNLDATFYERLNNTLSQLDNCIQSMVKGSKTVQPTMANVHPAMPAPPPISTLTFASPIKPEEDLPF